MNGSIIESLKNWTGITWATPKTRRSVERRWRRRFGDPRWAATGGCNMLKPKKALITCDTCGNHHEHFTICGYCYAIVKKETEELQKKVRETLLLSPVREEIELVYANEKETMNEKEFMGKRIVEIDRERPAWFAKNLLSLTGSASPNQDKSLKIDANRGQLKIKD
jgi:large subunit ribosomal protein L32